MKSVRPSSALVASASLLIAILVNPSTSRRIEAQSAPPDVILLASTARLAGAWRVRSLSGAAGGTATVLPDAGRAKVITAVADPADYFELTFDAAANVPYRFWVRGRATNDYRLNDSVHAQFTNSIDEAGTPRWRIGTTSSMEMNLEDCSGCGNSGWGWEDNGWGSVGALGPTIRFATSGRQTLRVQNREDGFYIDQIVLSASTYLTAAPGANKNDTTILIEPDPDPSDGAAEIVLHAASGRVAGAWQIVNEPSAASGRAAVLPDAVRPRVTTPLANPPDYVELTFPAVANAPYRLWVRGRADGNRRGNDSAYVQFSDSVTASGAPAWRIGSTSAARVILEPCNTCGISGWGWEDNGWGTPTTLGPEIRFATTGTKTLRVQSREDGFLIDQIVLSPSRYLRDAPGANRNDATLLSPTIPPPPLTPAVTIVRFPYLQQITDRSAVIVWATRESGAAEARVNGRAHAASSTRFTAARTGFSYDYFQHEAAITGLEPGTSYPYELRVGSARAGVHSFRTAPDAGPIRFIAFGDSGIGSTAQKTLAARMTSDAWDLALHVGDIVYGSTNTSGDASYKTYQWWFFDIYREWLKTRPFFPSMGNHDARQSNSYGRAYLDLFVLPDDAGAGAFPDHAERYYSFDYGPVHFVALDTERAFQDSTRRQAQLDWLRRDLASTTKLWKVAYWHRSPYSAGGEHGSDLAVRKAFGPVLEEHGVQLALTGHEHVYERTVPWRESADRSKQAVTYIITGGGGARLYPAAIAPWTAYSRSDYQYLRVAVDGCVLVARSVNRSGAAIDSFTLDRCAQASDAGTPSVRVTSPANGASVSGVVTVAAAASDDVRVEKVDFWIDGALRSIDRTASYSYSWDSRTAPAGTHRIEARAYDIDGNRVSSAVVTVTTSGS